MICGQPSSGRTSISVYFLIRKCRFADTPAFLENIWYICCGLLAQSLQQSSRGRNNSPRRFGCESAILRRQQLSRSLIFQNKVLKFRAKMVIWDWTRAIFVNQSEWRTLRILPDVPYPRLGSSGYEIIMLIVNSFSMGKCLPGRITLIRCLTASHFTRSRYFSGFFAM